MQKDFDSLVIKAQQGEGDSVEELVEGLMPLIYSSARRYYFGEESREDLIQEGILKILEELKRFDPYRGIPFLGYIKLRMKYFYMERGKKKKKENLQLPIEAWGTEGINLLEMLADPAVNIEEEMLKKEARISLETGIGTLSSYQKRVLYLHYGQGLNMRQIAQRLGVHYQTVVKTKERGIRHLRNIMRQG